MIIFVKMVLGISDDGGDDSCGDSDDIVVEVVMMVLITVFIIIRGVPSGVFLCVCVWGGGGGTFAISKK